MPICEQGNNRVRATSDLAEAEIMQDLLTGGFAEHGSAPQITQVGPQACDVMQCVLAPRFRQQKPHTIFPDWRCAELLHEWQHVINCAAKQMLIELIVFSTALLHDLHISNAPSPFLNQTTAA